MRLQLRAAWGGQVRGYGYGYGCDAGDKIKEASKAVLPWAGGVGWVGWWGWGFDAGTGMLGDVDEGAWMGGWGMH
jgi:hypothetical protein